MTGRAVTGVAAAAVALVAAAHAPAVAARCSLIPFPAPRPDGWVYALATPTSDTLRATPGAMLLEGVGAPGAEGHAGGRDESPDFAGQILTLERVDLRDPGRLAGHDRMLVVPWDYDPACRPLPWTGAALAWPVGRTGVYQLALRPDSLWVDGTPTADVLNVRAQGYERGALTPRLVGGPGALDAEQLLDLFTHVPWRSEVDALGLDALAPLDAWSARTGLADQVPADFIVRSTRYAADRAEQRLHPAEVAGTWRVMVELPSGSSHELFVRTARRPSGAARLTADDPTPSDGYDLDFWFARTRAHLDSLASGASPGRGVGSIRKGEWPIEVQRVDDPHRLGARWSGRLQTWQLEHFLPDVPEAVELTRLQRNDYRAMWEQGVGRGPNTTFIVDDDGGLRFETRWPIPDGGEVVLRGERIGPETFARWF